MIFSKMEMYRLNKKINKIQEKVIHNKKADTNKIKEKIYKSQKIKQRRQSIFILIVQIHNKEILINKPNCNKEYKMPKRKMKKKNPEVIHHN